LKHYGCGLRVSELVSLKISDLFLMKGCQNNREGNNSDLCPLEAAQKYIHIIRTALGSSEYKESLVILCFKQKGATHKTNFYHYKDLAVKTEMNKKISPHTGHSLRTFWKTVLICVQFN
jgi:integrase/recombinase XerD